MTRIVDLILLLVAVLTAIVWLPRMVSRGRHRTDWRARFGHTKQLGPPPSAGRVVLHAVSVGEIGAIRGLVQQLDQIGVDVVIASTTDTGVERARTLFGDRYTVVRWPFDFSWSVRRFLHAISPTTVGLVELEVWPNLTSICQQQGIPVVVVSGRLSARSHRRYGWIRPFVRPMFRRLAAVGAQTQEVADRFVSLGAKSSCVEVTGNMKWDSVGGGDDKAASEVLARSLGLDRSRTIVVGGSTAPGEDLLLRNACPEESQLLCAPRRPEWWNEAERVLSPCVRRSTGTTAHANSGRFLLDTIGELSTAYEFADVVVIGRSFGALHGSDPVEPIARGAAVVIGPAVSDFADTVKLLRDGGGLVQCDATELAAHLAELCGNRDARAKLVECGQAILRSQRGATAANVALLRGVQG
jgi:3-deoxy-D-manno-octulosonic-acid transferase